MTEQKHTPGPWRKWFSEAHDIHIISNESGQTRIAETLGFDTEEADAANAELIALAPDLLSENATLLSRLEEAEKRVNHLELECAHDHAENIVLRSRHNKLIHEVSAATERLRTSGAEGYIYLGNSLYSLLMSDEFKASRTDDIMGLIEAHVKKAKETDAELTALRDRNAVLTRTMELILAISKKYDHEDFNKISQSVNLCFEHIAALRDSGEPAKD